MTMTQYVNETKQLTEKLNANSPAYPIVAVRLSELYKAAVNEPWWPEYLKSMNA